MFASSTDDVGEVWLTSPVKADGAALWVVVPTTVVVATTAVRITVARTEVGQVAIA